ncbi:MAG: rhodanese-like domain-containing protein [Sandaracinaceae bacterium]|nr:rhodanese-like domain-containing protein [Sandaracinaceae bacterium]
MVAAGATLLDVRTPREFAAGHPDGAINIPVGDLERRIAEVPSEHGVVVYCHSGVRSASAARLLRARGYEVHDLGSMSAW